MFGNNLILSVFVILNIFNWTVAANDFGYDGKAGPDYWKEQYKECVGKHQSPINIDMTKVIPISYPQLIFENIEIEHPAKIVNNGHTVMMTFDTNENLPRIKGGPFHNTFEFVQLHFHWGDNDTFGSENRINNLSFPLELHMVFYNTEYNNSSEAMHYYNGLAVIAFLYEISIEDNEDYIDFVESLKKVHEIDTSTPIAHNESVLELIRPVVELGLQKYFTYEGSLTTPPCSEVVTWIEFKDPINLSHDQVDEFRQLSAHFGKLKHNFRPVQPINDRFVYYNILDNNIDKLDNGNNANAIHFDKYSNLLISIVFILMNFIKYYECL